MPFFQRCDPCGFDVVCSSLCFPSLPCLPWVSPNIRPWGTRQRPSSRIYELCSGFEYDLEVIFFFGRKTRRILFSGELRAIRSCLPMYSRVVCVLTHPLAKILSDLVVFRTLVGRPFTHLYPTGSLVTNSNQYVLQCGTMSTDKSLSCCMTKMMVCRLL